jgi:hypothetical protein
MFVKRLVRKGAIVRWQQTALYTAYPSSFTVRFFAIIKCDSRTSPGVIGLAGAVYAMMRERYSMHVLLTSQLLRP